MSERISDTIRREERQATREEFLEALRILRACNGADLDEWTEGWWPDDALSEVGKLIFKR